MDKYKGKGLTGLANLGNTCFLNSTIQCISHTYELNDLLERDNNKYFKNKKDVDTIICKEWDGLRKVMWSENCTIAPNRFVSTIQKVANHRDRDVFTGFAQNDVPEFLLFFIDEIHNALKRRVQIKNSGVIKNNTDKLAKECYQMVSKMFSKEHSEIIELFFGIHVSQILDMSDNVLIRNPEPFFMVNLPIPQNNKTPNITDCFDLYTSNEIMTGENQWYNEKESEKQDVKKNIKFFSLPNILVIDFKRFNNMNKKNNIFIDFPLEDLDLSKYIIGYDKDSFVYDCYGICNHSGTSNGGHYTSFVKNADNNWYHFNDTQVVKINNDSVKKIKSQHAYCLFYRKK
tara:strand:+ start:6 stop:1037 length:1032 start_codon:yes stop_codon:yes gene_type:complete